LPAARGAPQRTVGRDPAVAIAVVPLAERDIERVELLVGQRSVAHEAEADDVCLGQVQRLKVGALAYGVVQAVCGGAEVGVERREARGSMPLQRRPHLQRVEAAGALKAAQPLIPRTFA
jgi:hypothetical protein